MNAQKFKRLELLHEAKSSSGIISNDGRREITRYGNEED